MNYAFSLLLGLDLVPADLPREVLVTAGALFVTDRMTFLMPYRSDKVAVNMV